MESAGKGAFAVSREVLVVVAHPDDETLGMGGTIRRLANDGDSVYVGVLADGVTSRYWPFSGPEELSFKDVKVLERQGQAERAFGILGVRNHDFARYSDQRLDEKPFLRVVKRVEDWISVWHPQVIFTHAANDLNMDHRIVHQAVLTAARPHKVQIDEILAFEVPTSTELGLKPFNPTVFFDISDTLEVKKEAFACYQEDFPEPQYIDFIAKRYGYMVGYKAAEAFELVRMVR